MFQSNDASQNPFFQSAEGVPATSPFAVRHPFDSEPEEETLDDAPEGTYSYAMIKSGPEVASEECETSDVAVEVKIVWGGETLAINHLSPPRSFYVGEEERANIKCDFLIPADTLGATRAPLVVVDAGNVYAVLLPNATGSVQQAGTTQTIAALRDSGALAACPELAGALLLPLAQGTGITMDLNGVSFELGAVRAGRKVAGGLKVERRGFGYAGLSALVHLGLLGAVALYMPPLGSTDASATDEADKYRLIHAMAALQEPEKDKSEEVVEDVSEDGSRGGTGARAMGEEGKAGSEVSKETNNHLAIKKTDDTKMYLSRREAIQEAEQFGMIGLLSSDDGTLNAPTTPWGMLAANGPDDMNADGNMWGDNPGDSHGSGGVGLSGIGEGGGGKYEGIGLGYIGTVGRGSGNCKSGPCDGFGNSNGTAPGMHRTKPPIMRTGGSTVSGRIPPEVVQRIVRQNFGRFRMCYQNGLRNNPNLSGRVAVRFVIGRDGAVGSVGNGGSDMPDAGVVSCVVSAFYGLSFPAPENGIVTVTYPIMFAPGG